MSCKTQVLVISDELDAGENEVYPKASIRGYGLNLVVEPGYYDAQSLENQYDTYLIEGSLKVSF